MKFTVRDIRNAIHGLPGELRVEFSPITSAYLGANHRLRFDEICVFTEDGEAAEVTDKQARIVVYIKEDLESPI